MFNNNLNSVNIGNKLYLTQSSKFQNPSLKQSSNIPKKSSDKTFNSNNNKVLKSNKAKNNIKNNSNKIISKPIKESLSNSNLRKKGTI